ncbi:MAG: flagellar hook-basal body complex protein FliE [Solirubrobacteraceae bacterium]
MNIPAIGIGPLGRSEWSVGGVGTGADGQASGANFGDALNGAISSLNATQNTANQTEQQLATGQLSDPTQAVTAVENANLAMDYAAQIRNLITTDAQTIFETQL